MRADGEILASVERKSLSDLLSSLSSGRLRFAVAELATLARAAVVVEDRYSQVFKQDRVRPSQVLDALAELQVRWPTIPIVFCETRKLAEEWTYRYLAAALTWVGDGRAAGPAATAPPAGPAPVTAPSPAEVRAWARRQGYQVPDRGRVRADIQQAWHAAQRAT